MITRTSKFLLPISLFFLAGLFACSDTHEYRHWLSTVPSESPFVMLQHDADFFEVLENLSVSLEAMSTIRLTELADREDRFPGSLQTKAIAMFPTGSHEMQPLFILEDSGYGISAIAGSFRRPYAENSYRFEGHRIHILHLDRQQLFATQLHDWILISSNSAAVENGILTYTGMNPAIDFPGNQYLQDGDYLLNTPKLSNWIKLLGAPRYLPRFKEMFDGTEPAVLSISGDRDDDPMHHFTLTGTIPLSSEAHSNLVSTFSSDAGNIDLDRYIPVDAAFFALYRDGPIDEPPDDVEIISKLDSMLVNNVDRFQDIARTLAAPAAFAIFEASGSLTTGEYMYLRRLSNGAAFQRVLNELEEDGYIEESNNVFHISSNVMSRLLGGAVSNITDFYVIRSSNAAVITQRSGLTRRIDQDRRRRAVYYYDDDYMEIRRQHPELTSALIYSRNIPLMNYLEPHLNPVNHAGFLSGISDIGVVSLVRNGHELAVRMDGYFTEDRTEPVRELWVYSLGGSRLTGKPVLANILGGARNEIIVATENNNIHGISSDGTGFLEISTSNDRPVGSPVVYDWYGNNQYAILVAAGNKVYAWNARGIPLPNFPVTLDETITAPLVLADVNRNGRPEMIVTTADRQVHVLDQRGVNISGWPQEVNVSVRHKPSFRNFNGQPTLLVTAGNGLFGFSPRGELTEDFPVFIESSFGPITHYEQHILAGASNGHLYAIGRGRFFTDTSTVEQDSEYEITRDDSELDIQRVYVDNSAIINAPIVETLTLTPSDANNEETGNTVTEPMIGVQTLSGNLFLLNRDGQLLLVRNMGQPSAEYDNMVITDLNSDGKPDMIGVTETGRVYAWQVESGEPFPNIPTASIRHFIITDLLANNEQELIGQTRDGLRGWSFRRP